MPKSSFKFKNISIYLEKKLLILSVVFIFYLIALPELLVLGVPCLKTVPGVSYADDACRLSLAMDSFLFWSISALAVAVLIIHFRLNKDRSILKTAIYSSILAILIIILFIKFIPRAESAVKRAPIIIFTPQK